MMKIPKQITMVIIVLQFSLINSISSQVSSLPLIEVENLEYQGGFIIPSIEAGESNSNYSTGTIAINSETQSLFLSGFDLHGSIAEFTIPTLVNSKNLDDLNTASILQDFRRVLNESITGNPQGIDRISGLKYINNKLIVNGVEYYDAGDFATNTTLIVETPSNLANSVISGYYSIQGAAHAAGWLSPIPQEWQAELGGDFIAGSSSKYAINTRLAVGISAFALNSSNLTNPLAQVIPTDTLLDYDVANPLHADYNSYEKPNYNAVKVVGDASPFHTVDDIDITVGENHLWTQESQASYGFIVPGTRTYLSIGSSGGHFSGMGYKATQNNGNRCHGPCPYDPDDVYNHYWLWDVNDLVKVKNGIIASHDVRPYAYGIFDAPFQTDAFTNTPEFHSIFGGDFDPNTGLLYLSLYDGGSKNNPYEKNPLIVAYKINESISLSNSNVDATEIIQLFPNPSTGFVSISTPNNTLENVIFYNELGQLIKESKANEINLSRFSSGFYLVKIILKNGSESIKKLIIE